MSGSSEQKWHCNVECSMSSRSAKYSQIFCSLQAEISPNRNQNVQSLGAECLVAQSQNVGPLGAKLSAHFELNVWLLGARMSRLLGASSGVKVASNILRDTKICKRIKIICKRMASLQR